MKLDLSEKDGIAILELRGRLTVGTDQLLREAIDTLLGAHRSNILLDCTELTFMDSQGIGELVSSMKTVKKFGGQLKILKPGKRIKDSLELSALLPVFEIYEDTEEAIESFDQASEETDD